MKRFILLSALILLTTSCFKTDVGSGDSKNGLAQSSTSKSARNPDWIAYKNADLSLEYPKTVFSPWDKAIFEVQIDDTLGEVKIFWMGPEQTKHTRLIIIGRNKSEKDILNFFHEKSTLSGCSGYSLKPSEKPDIFDVEILRDGTKERSVCTLGFSYRLLFNRTQNKIIFMNLETEGIFFDKDNQILDTKIANSIKFE